MGAGIYSIGVSALKVAQAGISVTTHNIANVNTPGFSRQELVQGALTGQSTDQGFFGQGADVLGVRRHYNDFLGAQLAEAQTRASSLATQYDLAQQVSNLMADMNGGLSVSIQDFFGAVNGVADAPESQAARQNLLGSAQTLADQFHALDARLAELRDSLNTRISDNVGLINSYARQIATLNDSIVRAQAQGGSGETPNDLLDQRDYLLTQLSQQIRVSSVRQPNGSLDVFIGNGQSLVIGNQTATLQAMVSLTDPSALEVVYSSNRGISRIQQSALQGGSLGALMTFRSSMLDPAQNALGRIAIGLAATFNQQHRQGMDLKGVLGGDFFVTGAAQANAASNNVGNGTLMVTLDDPTLLTGADYELRFDGTAYNLMDSTTHTTVQSFTAAALATPQTVTGAGFTLQLNAGTVADVAGDAWLIRPTVAGARDFALALHDASRIAAASPVRASASLANLGSGAISQPTVAGYPLDVNLQQPITLTFTSPTTYTVSGTGAPAGVQTYSSGATIAINGWRTQITGIPMAGDTFTIVPNSNASTDGSNMLKLAQLQTANTLANRTTSYQGAYAQLVSQVGSQTRELEVTSKAQDTLLAQVTRAQQSVSGVNLDEEAANLLRYQQAYQAAAKAMAIAQTMFDAVLKIGG